MSRMVARHILMISMFAGLLLVAVATFAGAAPAAAIGAIILVVAATLWTVLYTFGRILREQLPLPKLLARVALMALVLTVLLLAGVGAWSLWTEWPAPAGK